MTTPYVIDKISWHTSVKGNEAFHDVTYAYFAAFVDFVNANGLAAIPIKFDSSSPDDNFVIKSSDLTNEGLVLVKTAYTDWQRFMDRGGDPTDTQILQRALAKLRGQS